MKVLVTGAAGLTGGAVVRELLGRGHEVVGVVRDPGRRDAVPAPACPVVAETANQAAMAPLLADADAVCHVAGILVSGGLIGPSTAAPRTLLVVSTAALYSGHQPAIDGYRRHEELLMTARPDVILVRPTMIYGSPRDRNVHRAIDFARRFHFLPLVGDGSGLLQPIHYEDLASAIVTLVERAATGIVDAGGAEPLTMRDAARAILDALRMPRRLVPTPMPLALAAARSLDAVRGGRWAEKVERAVEDRVVDNARLVALTGVQPREFARGVRDQVALG